MHVIPHLSKPTECITRMSNKLNYGQWVIIMFQDKSIRCSKGMTLVEDVKEGGYKCLRTGMCRKFQYHPLNFAMNENFPPKYLFLKATDIIKIYLEFTIVNKFCHIII